MALLSQQPGIARGYEVDTSDLVDPAYSAAIPLVIWIKDSVSSADQAQMVEQILRGASLWEQVPTACVGFQLSRVVRGSTRPSINSGELLVMVSGEGDTTMSPDGTSFPSGGNPGIWFDASTVLLDTSEWPDSDHAASIAAHELGHAIGLHHSSISIPYASMADVGAMHWTQPPFRLSQDDIAGISLAYPCTGARLSSATGSVTGRLVTRGGTPISGIDAIAYNVQTHVPVAARITGQFADQGDGVYRIEGLPPGTYRVDFVDSHYYQGSRHDASSLGQGYDYQCDNMDSFSSSEFVVQAGGSVSLPDAVVDIAPMSFDSLAATGASLPAAGLDLPYSFHSKLLGGLRDVDARLSITPPSSGLTAELVETSEYAWEPLGALALQVTGTPRTLGHFEIQVGLTDREATAKSFVFGLNVVTSPPLSPDLVIDDYNYSPQFPTSLDQVQLRFVVKNRGLGSSAPSRAAMRIGGETVPIVFDVPALQPDQGIALQRRLNGVPPRSYVVSLRANSGSAPIVEADADNDERSFVLPIIGPPDLMVERASARPSSQPANGNVVFAITVRNRGQATSPLARGAITVDGATTSFFTIFELAPGASASYERYARLSPGDHRSEISVDYDHRVAESNERNNKLLQSFRIGN